MLCICLLVEEMKEKKRKKCAKKTHRCRLNNNYWHRNGRVTMTTTTTEWKTNITHQIMSADKTNVKNLKHEWKKSMGEHEEDEAFFPHRRRNLHALVCCVFFEPNIIIIVVDVWHYATLWWRLVSHSLNRSHRVLIFTLSVNVDVECGDDTA